MARSIAAAFTVGLLCTIAFGYPAPQELTAEAKVSLNGTITVSGRPLESGRILFYDDEGQIFGAVVGKHGVYSIKRPGIGQHKITIDGEGIPAKFSAIAETVLRFDIRDAANVCNFDLAGES